MSADFPNRVIAWQRRSGRHDLPWQGTRDPYRIWLSEVMLQQTQVSTVLPYYLRFIEAYPDVARLAAAEESAVLRLWSGLGYYARARNLHRAARLVAAQGAFPRKAEALAALPGLGRSSAAAIAVFAWGERAAILDGNVKRVLARCFGIGGFPGEAAVARRLWAIAEAMLPAHGIEAYTQGLMDLGATVCTRAAPRCDGCPLARDCVARRDARIGELPGARPAKKLPLRRARWLVAQRGGKILLERRPASGLWGGLLAFPELGPGEIRGWCERIVGAAPQEARRLAVVEHGFSHFRLRAQPVLCALPPRAAAGIEQPGRVWLDVGQALAEAIPAPVRRVLDSMGGTPDATVSAPAAAAKRRVSAAAPRSRARGDPA